MYSLFICLKHIPRIWNEFVFKFLLFLLVILPTSDVTYVRGWTSQTIPQKKSCARSCSRPP